MTCCQDSAPVAVSDRLDPAPAGFWTVAAVLVLFFLASAVPSPLYVVYQRAWGFSDTTLTAVFAVYVVALLGALLVFGSLSDVLGRRRVILLALVLEMLTMVTFASAQGVGWLYAARFLQGLATGIATAALSAALIDRQPDGPVALGPLTSSAAPAGGLAVGALAAGFGAQYGPAPTRLVYLVLLAAFGLATVGVFRLAEAPTARRLAAADLRPRVHVPAGVRRPFAAALPCIVGLWALSGLYLSLGPSVAAQLTGSTDIVIGGVVVALLTGLGCIAIVVGRDRLPQRAMQEGTTVLLAGLVVTGISIQTRSAAGLFAGIAVAGPGFGLAFLGAFRTLVGLADPWNRSGLVAAIYVVSYLAFSVPAIVAGVLAAHIGLHRAALAFSAADTAIVAVALVLLRRAGRVSRGAAG